MQRYFVNIRLEEVIFDENDIFHILKVMRGKVGDNFEVVDQAQNLYLVRLTSIKPFAVTILEPLTRQSELKNTITLYYVMAKGEKTDWVIQKATELGVDKIVLLHSKRSVVRVESAKVDNKVLRLSKIAKEAAEQAKRLIIPSVSIHQSFTEIADDTSTLKLIADEDAAGTTQKLYSLLDSVTSSDSIALLVGAEGGFDREEVAYATKIGFKVVGLGSRILRSETAAIHLVGIVASYLERR